MARPPGAGPSVGDLARTADRPADPRVIDQDGPAAVLTLGRLRPSQALRFFRTSAKAEAAVLGADGLTWATGFGRPPIFSTFSLWETPQALSAYAYGQSDRAHPEAIAADRAEPFHRESAFIRFRPYDSTGSLEGSNPLPESWMSTPGAPERRSP